MTGILLIVVVGLWVWAAIAIGKKLTANLKPAWVRALSALLLMAVLIPLPVVDEIIGRFQFKGLCEKNGPKEDEFSRAQGKRLIVKMDGNLPVSGQLLHTTGFNWMLLDESSLKPVITFMDYRAKGGWLIRTLGISETKAPLIFSASCWGDGDEESFQGWLTRHKIINNFNATGEMK
jgi:hypothetical protein